MASIGSEDREWREEIMATEKRPSALGVIVHSWAEAEPSADTGIRVVSQVVTRVPPEALVIVETEASLVSDRLWMET